MKLSNNLQKQLLVIATIIQSILLIILDLSFNRKPQPLMYPFGIIIFIVINYLLYKTGTKKKSSEIIEKEN